VVSLGVGGRVAALELVAAAAQVRQVLGGDYLDGLLGEGVYLVEVGVDAPAVGFQIINDLLAQNKNGMLLSFKVRTMTRRKGYLCTSKLREELATQQEFFLSWHASILSKTRCFPC
jgi:hypothetical protein